ncbi:MAG: DegQ family serine endoprotease [Deltaproteobacteria bacterium]|nr:DegQ family serine endoprotease [Deltaproteobacteria bacterium]MBW2307114.1 DegQ family serine endoprotease [Deltaproteobacteria bacterium]
MKKHKGPIKTFGAFLSIFLIMTITAPIGYSASSTGPLLTSSAGQRAHSQEIQFPSFADMAERLKPAVVNIFTTKVIKGRPFKRFYHPFEEKGGPFEEFFERYKQFFGEVPEQEYRQRSLGSGFIIDPKGFILTNNHVIENADEIKVRLNNEKEYEATVVGRDPATDLALIKVKTKEELPTALLGNSDALRVGEWVLAIGNPFGYGHTVTVGIVSAMGRTIGAGPYDDFIQTDASINPGNSGGPLFNVRGEVVGINTAIVASGQGIGFATPINKASELLPQLKTGKVTRGWLGVGIQEVSDDLAKNFELKKKRGALVSEVFPDEPAEKAGIKRGDIILELNGKQIKNVKELLNIAASLPVGRKIEIKVWREGETLDLNLIVGKRPEEKKLLSRSWRTPLEEEEEESLGITVVEITPDLAKRLDLPMKEGVIVKNVKPQSPAGKAGLQQGDIILEINRIPVKNLKEYKETVEKFSNASSLLVLMKRGSSSQYLVLKKGT